MLSNFNKFEIMKVRKIYCRTFLEKVNPEKPISFIFFVKFTEDWNFPLFLSLLWSFMCRNECQKLDIYFIFDCSVSCTPTIDLQCYFIAIRNGKIMWKHGPYCWYSCLNLTFLGWSYKEYIEMTLMLFRSYRYSANTSEAIEAMAIDEKDYHKCSLCVTVCIATTTR